MKCTNQTEDRTKTKRKPRQNIFTRKPDCYVAERDFNGVSFLNMADDVCKWGSLVWFNENQRRAERYGTLITSGTPQ